METITTSFGKGTCQLCLHSTSIYNPPTRSKLTSQLRTYLYHENVKGPFISSCTTELDPPKLTFTISTEKRLNLSPPIICKECSRQLDKLDKLHQHLESVKNSIDYQMKLITRKRLLQNCIVEDDGLLTINKSLTMMTPGISMTGASIGKENIHQSLTFLNSICAGMTSTTTSLSPVPIINNVQRGNESSTVIRKQRISIGPDPLGENDETPEATTVKMNLDTSAYLQVEMYDENEDGEVGTGYTKIEPSCYAYRGDPTIVAVLNNSFPSKCQDLKFKADIVGLQKGKGMRPQKKCQDCGKMISAGNFAVHRRVHSRETPYVCKYCQKGFTQLNTLKLHLTSKHIKTGNHKCGACGQDFSFKFDLETHLESVHSC